MPLPKFSLQFAFSWSVYFSNRTESYSSQIEFAGPHGIRRPTFTAEERLERRREQDRRRHAERRARERREQTQARRDVDRLRSSQLKLTSKQNRTRAHAVVYVTAEIFKKGKKKTNMPLPKFSLQFAFSWSVYSFHDHLHRH